MKHIIKMLLGTLICAILIYYFIAWATPDDEDTVYVCKSPTSYAYHTSEDCKGLSKCTHGIEKMSEDDAEYDGKTPCGYCHNK